MSLTAALGLEGYGVPITWRGQIYTLMPASLKCEQGFTAWMTAQARQELVAMRPHMELEDYAAAVAHFAVIAPGKFAFNGEEARKRRGTPEGTVKFVHCMLLEKHPKISEKAVADMLIEEREQIELAMQDFFRQVSAASGQTEEETPTTEMEILTPNSKAS